MYIKLDIRAKANLLADFYNLKGGIGMNANCMQNEPHFFQIIFLQDILRLMPWKQFCSGFFFAIFVRKYAEAQFKQQTAKKNSHKNLYFNFEVGTWMT
jgi:hypothetical protein